MVITTISPDDLDNQQIDQLHAAVLQIAGNCFELKKLCATTIVAVGTLIAAFTDKNLDTSIFVGGLLIVLVFWLADAQSYYYQKKLRLRMAQLQESRVRRANLSYPTEGVGLSVSDPHKQASAQQALLNLSMLFYAFLAFLIGFSWILFCVGVIGA